MKKEVKIKAKPKAKEVKKVKAIASDKKEERTAKAAQLKEKKEAAKSAKVARRQLSRMPERNGIRRPKPNTICGKVWALADSLSAKFRQPTPIKNLIEASETEGLNIGNVKAEYARWRKFNGVTGRVEFTSVGEKKTKEKAA